MEQKDNRQEKIETIRRLPAQVETLIFGLSREQMTAVGIAGEWTVAQILHHLCDAHMNSFIRHKLILTEDNPTLKSYNEVAWAQTPDGNSPDWEQSLALLRGLHHRWTILWENMDADDWERVGTTISGAEISVADLLTIYDGHSKAHLAQLRQAAAAII